mmetsp:Transcript_6704/g.11954  ORF Transcript_6704/g.11954 Transcript_6704/m.11954 type:complete len:109 (-) Transcript_6704:1155-1481(-)
MGEGLGLSSADMQMLEQHHRSSMRLNAIEKAARAGSDSDTDSDNEGTEKPMSFVLSAHNGRGVASARGGGVLASLGRSQSNSRPRLRECFIDKSPHFRHCRHLLTRCC